MPSESNPHLEFHPVLPKSIYITIALLPFAIFLFGFLFIREEDSQLLIPLLIITVLLPLIIFILMKNRQNDLSNNYYLKIEGFNLIMKLKQEEKTFDLRETESIALFSKFGFATDIKIQQDEKEIIPLSIGGVLSPTDLKKLEEILKKKKVELKH